MKLTRRAFIQGAAAGLAVAGLPGGRTIAGRKLNPASAHAVWLIVAAGSAPLRAWADDDAPLTGRLSQGTLRYCVDRLMTRTGPWVGFADGCGGVVWARASLWRPAPATP